MGSLALMAGPRVRSGSPFHVIDKGGNSTQKVYAYTSYVDMGSKMVNWPTGFHFLKIFIFILYRYMYI